MSVAEEVSEGKRVSRRGIWGWMLFDWAQQPFHTLVITFVFAPYFASAVAPNAAQGQEMWGLATGVGGLLIALSSPILGAIADASGPRKPWIAVFAVVGILANMALWFAVPDMQHLWLVMALVSLAVFGMEFAAVFNNAMMPGLVPARSWGGFRARPGALAISAGWSHSSLCLASCRPRRRRGEPFWVWSRSSALMRRHVRATGQQGH